MILSSAGVSKLLTYYTGLPAHKVFAGILLPAETVEFGAITQPLYNCAPYIITDLWPIWTLSSTKHENKKQLF